MAAQESGNKTFRFKFSEKFQCILEEFAKLHRYDNRHIFKEAWEKWIELHDSEITQETTRLKTNGYEGSPLDKMYKSARYYFRKKKDEKNKPKQRRKYVNVSKEIIALMDDHLINSMRNNDFTPANAFDDFCYKYKSNLVSEIERLLIVEELNNKEITPKIKKTFKNRYFLKVN